MNLDLRNAARRDMYCGDTDKSAYPTPSSIAKARAQLIGRLCGERSAVYASSATCELPRGGTLLREYLGIDTALPMLSQSKAFGFELRQQECRVVA